MNLAWQAMLKALGPSSVRVALARLSHERDFKDLMRPAVEQGFAWIGIVRWRTRRDLERAMSKLLHKVPEHPQSEWIQIHIFEPGRTIYYGSAVAFRAASDLWCGSISAQSKAITR